MTSELFYLTLCALLASSLWIPYIIGVNGVPKDNVQADFERPRDLKTLPAWIHRAHRAHLNLIEQFVPFAVLVIVAHLLAVSNSITIWSTIAFFWLRVIHAFGMISGITKFPVRPALFVACWICILLIAWQVMAA